MVVWKPEEACLWSKMSRIQTACQVTWPLFEYWTPTVLIYTVFRWLLSFAIQNPTVPISCSSDVIDKQSCCHLDQKILSTFHRIPISLLLTFLRVDFKDEPGNRTVAAPFSAGPHRRTYKGKDLIGREADWVVIINLGFFVTLWSVDRIQVYL